MNEWDGTAWAGSVVKAETGPYVSRMQWGDYFAARDKTPQAGYRRAQAAYHGNPWIGTAEGTVTRRVAGLPWHLEDGEDEEWATDGAPDLVTRAVRLLERPQANLAPEMRDPALLSWRSLVSLTSRHLGLCGMTHWYLDGQDQYGIPSALLYLNPCRMWAATAQHGRLLGWVLDPADDYGNGGTPLELSEVLTFYLDPPDHGPYASGFYARASMKANLTTIADQHAAFQLSTGGRLPGIVTPREGTIAQEQYEQLVREFRNVNEAPDAAKRTTIVRGPVDFLKTSADPSDLGLGDLMRLNRDDILAIWGVPPSTAGVPAAAGLNSGGTREYDEATLMQGTVHDRVRAISETIQYGLLDRWQKAGYVIDLEIEEPEFDDETPAYERAAKATVLPLTNAERREIIGLAPFGDTRDAEVWLPATSVLAYGPTGAVPAPAGPPPAKAQRDYLGLRASVERRWVPAIRTAVAEYLAGLRDRAAAKVRNATPAEVSRHRRNAQHWLGSDTAEGLLAAIRPHIAALAGSVHERATGLLAAGKADDAESQAVATVLRSLGTRIGGIDETIRGEVIGVVTRIFDEGLSMADGADLMAESGAFGEYRAEMIARTESMLAYNESALRSYNEFGVGFVEAIDGDEDEACAARNGQTYPVDEAFGITDHPNGTLDWVPIVDYGARASLAEPAHKGTVTWTTPSVTISPPVVTVEAPPPAAAPVVTVEAPAAYFDTAALAAAMRDAMRDFAKEPARPTARRIERDDAGLIVRIVEEPV